jgi:hypothetical protein
MENSIAIIQYHPPKVRKFAQSNLISHSSTCPSLAGGKILRYLIYYAQEYHKCKDKHEKVFTLKLAQLSRFLGQSPAVYIPAIRGLVRSVIHWHQFAKYREPGVFKESPVLQYLETPWDEEEEELEAKTKRDYIVYQFSEHLHNALMDPKFFRIFNMSLIQQFRSKYTLQLYSFCLSCLNDKDNFAYTPFLTEKELRSLLGCEKTYSDIRRFHQDVILPSQAEFMYHVRNRSRPKIQAYQGCEALWLLRQTQGRMAPGTAADFRTHPARNPPPASRSFSFPFFPYSPILTQR